MVKRAERSFEGAVTHSMNRWARLSDDEQKAALINELRLLNEWKWLEEALTNLRIDS